MKEFQILLNTNLDNDISISYRNNKNIENINNTKECTFLFLKK